MQEQQFKELAQKHLGSPRMHMFIILNICALIGFIMSYILARRVGIEEMWIRYAISSLTAYLAFFVLVKFWLSIFLRERLSGPKIISAKNIKKAWKQVKHARKLKKLGGISRSGSAMALPEFDLKEALSEGGSDKEGFIIFVLIAVVIGIALAVGAFLFAAPIFWGEVIGAALVGSGSMRHFKKIRREEWYEAAFRRSRWHFLALFLILVLGGAFLQYSVPEAITIGDILKLL